MIKKLIKNFKIKKALKVALKEYDRATLLDILEFEKDGWSNGTEILNGLEYETTKNVLSTIK